MPATTHSRVSRACTRALAESFAAFPRLLKESEPEEAAAIVADLIKFTISQDEKAPQKDPLQEILRKLEEEDE